MSKPPRDIEGYEALKQLNPIIAARVSYAAQRHAGLDPDPERPMSEELLSAVTEKDLHPDA